VGHDSIVPGTLETCPTNASNTTGTGATTSSECSDADTTQEGRSQPEARSVGEGLSNSLAYASGYHESRQDGITCPDNSVGHKAGVPPRIEMPTSPEPVPAPETPTLGELREQAIEHMLADETSQARQALDAILRQEPDDAESLLGKALLLAGTGDSDGALECGQRVLDANPVSAEAYCVLALVHEGLGENELARRELEKAIYLDNGFAIAHFRLACLHGRAGRKDDAMREFSNTFMALAYDDEQRIRLYSGGFDTETIARLCGQQLGIEEQQKGDRSNLPERPAGCSAQIGPVPFSLLASEDT